MAQDNRWSGTASAADVPHDPSVWPGTGTALIDFGSGTLRPLQFTNRVAAIGEAFLLFAQGGGGVKTYSLAPAPGFSEVVLPAGLVFNAASGIAGTPFVG